MQRPTLGKTTHSAGSPSFRQDLEEHVGTLVPAETLDWLRKALPPSVLVCFNKLMKSFLGFFKLLSAFPPSTPLICHGRGSGSASASVLLESV